MKTKKMNLGNIKDLLTRDEMKQVLAGCGGYGSCTIRCNQDTSTSKPVPDCSINSASNACGGNISNAVCICY